MEKYNGYTNRETWLTALHISSLPATDKGIYDFAVQRIKLTGKTAETRYDIADFIRNIVDYGMEKTYEHGLKPIFWDLLRASYERINFEEIAENYMEG